ncbi:ABC transporter permease [Roseivirga seohaensis]|uniref:ABC transporter permease n=1 Tax=Roseivirga seohaensis TaxID=1914963 RepID=UPI003BAB4F49
MPKKKFNTPKLANWLAAKCINKMYLEEFLGDLQEIYEDRMLVKGKRYARFMYWIDALHLLIGFSSFSLFKTQNNNTMMVKNMFKIAWRNAIRQKQFTVLNLLGLIIGISISLTIGLFIHHETTYDTFLPEIDRVYRVNQPNIWSDWTSQMSNTGPNVAVALREEVPEFEEVTRIMSLGSQITNYKMEAKKDKSFEESAFFAVENNFFEVFPFEFSEGNPKTAIEAPNSMVITQSTAERYFGYESAIGKTLEVKQWDNTWQSFVVTGVLVDVPSKSHLQFDVLVSLNSYQAQMDRDGWKWIWTAFGTYAKVNDGTNMAALNDKIQAIPPKYAPATTERIFNQSFEEFTAGNPWKLTLQPVKEIYLSEEPPYNAFGPVGNPQIVKVFMAIGILVLVLSCINFMNLSTARSSNRAKEVGIRKVLGSERGTLIKQFIFESTLFVAVSTVAALFIVNSSLGWFNAISGKELLLIPYLSQPVFIAVLLVFVLLLGFIAGSYPAFYLSSFKPIQVLKGKMSAGFKGKGIRNGLVVFQFTISMTLIICTFFVQKQLNYTSNLDLGFAKENVLQIGNIEQMGFDTERLKTELAALPAFTKVGKSFGVPPYVDSGDRYKSTEPEAPVVALSNLRIEADYLDVLGLELLAGRNFDQALTTDKYKVILNEEAVKVLGWGGDDPTSAVGQFVALASGSEDKFEVIGVVKDFNFASVRQEIAPLIFINIDNDKVWDYGAGLSFYSMRLNPQVVSSPEDLQAVLEQVEVSIKAVDATIPFEYSFLDEDFENTFQEESRMSLVLNIFTIMALIIACLGLFGLAAFSAEQRLKELGIRKVLGAKISELVLLFSSEFTKLFLIAMLLASPIAYFLVDQWLSDFANRTPIHIWVFAASTLGTLAIAIATISYQSLRSAHKNPVDTLRSE